MNKVKIKTFDNYMAFIINSQGSKTFKNFYVETNGKIKDVANDGEFSCALFVSSILCLFKLIKSGHATVESTIKDMQNSGWNKIKTPKPGAVIVWEKVKTNKHMGFFMGKDEAISNSSASGYPQKHLLTFGKTSSQAKRKIEAIFWNKKLEDRNRQ